MGVLKTKIEKSSGLKFDGINDYIETPFNYPVSEATPVSFSFFFKLLSSTTANDIILNSRDNSEKGINITNRNYSGQRKLDLTLINDFTPTVRVSGVTINTTIQTGIVYHIVFTKSNGWANTNFKGYIDSVEDSNYDFNTIPLQSGDNTASLNNFKIGAYNGNLASNIELYDFKMFNKTLTQSEVNELFTTKGKSVPVTSAANLLVNYRFDDKQGFVLKDMSSNNFDGTLTNYTAGDVAVSNTNKWVYEDGTPFDYTKSNIIRQQNQNWTFGDGLKFDGVNNYVQSSVNLNMTNDFSFSFIIQYFLSQPYYFVFGDLNNRIQIDNPEMRVLFTRLGVNLSAYTSNIIFNNGEIIYCTITKSNSTITFYKNGQLQNSVAIVNPASAVCTNLRVGTEAALGTFSSQNIYDLKIFNKTLNQLEVMEMYLKENQSIPVSAVSNLIANYKFNQKQGFVVKDTSGNNLDGTLINYTVSDVTVGVNNKWVNKYGNSIIQL